MFNRMQLLAVGAVLVLVGLSTWATLVAHGSRPLTDAAAAEQFSTMMH